MTPYTIYCRKSQEDEERQVQSLPDQEREMRAFANKCNVPVIEALGEAKSAKAPGRPVFNDMMDRVDRGEIRGVFCWKLDRLARNPVDGGRIIWAIKQHGLVVRTPHQTFSRGDDNIILMYIEFGMAQKYVDDLSRNTTRGLESKAKKGWYPGVAPLGYLNSKVEERGHRTILKDPGRFDAVRRMWDLVLTGNYSPARIQKIANEDWQFRTRHTKRTGGKAVARSTVYKMFSEPFYYGRFEYPRGSGQWYQGSHDPMVTEAEFNCVQGLLHRKTNRRPKSEFALPLRGLIKCGGCGSSITGHFKEQIRCTRCRYKSSVKNSGACARCGLATTDMKTPILRRYAYYHCTRTSNPKCGEMCISAPSLEKQLAIKIQAYGLPTKLRDWGLGYIEKLREHDLAEKAQILRERRKAYEQCVARLENLIRLKTAPENTGGSLISDEEYQKQRADLLFQKSDLSNATSTFGATLEVKVRAARDMLTVVGTSEEPPSEDAAKRNREVLASLGLNHVLKAKELEIRPEFPFSDLPFNGKSEAPNLTPIEPQNTQEIQSWNGNFKSDNLILERGVDDDRTNSLQIALDGIWKKLDPFSPALKRYPFNGKPLTMPLPRRNRKGRFAHIPQTGEE